MKNKRLLYLDQAKGIGIILVVIGHSTYAGDSIMQWLSSFHMPLFFLIAGLLLGYTGEKDRAFGESVKSKAKRLLIPYGIFSVFYFLLYIEYLWKKQLPIDLPTLGDSFLQILTFQGISVLWFLPALFFSQVLFLAVIKKTGVKGSIITGILAICGLMFLNPWFQGAFLEKSTLLEWLVYYLVLTGLRVLLAYLFIEAGYVLWVLFSKQKVSAGKSFLLAVLCLSANGILAFMQKTTDMHYMVIGNLFLYLITAFLGGLGVLLLCQAFPYSPEKSLLGYLGKNSLIIMLTHLDFRIINIAIHMTKRVVLFLTVDSNWVFCLVMGVFVLVLELACIWIINHYFYFLLAQKKPQTTRQSEL